MNCRELRIGNYVLVGERIVKVNGITQHKIGYCPKPGYEKYARSGEVEPIPITPDIAAKCEVYLSRNNLNGKYGILIGSGFVDVEYLHVLQNLYFLYYGKELKVNL